MMNGGVLTLSIELPGLITYINTSKVVSLALEDGTSLLLQDEEDIWEQLHIIVATQQSSSLCTIVGYARFIGPNIISIFNEISYYIANMFCLCEKKACVANNN